MKIPEKNMSLTPLQQALVGQLELIMMKLHDANCRLVADHETNTLMAVNESGMCSNDYTFFPRGEGYGKIENFQDWINAAQVVSCDGIWNIADLPNDVYMPLKTMK